MATGWSLENQTRRVLSKYLYEIVRRERSSHQIYIESQWRTRLPFDDERGLGLSEARTRLIIRARPRRSGATAGGMDLFTVRLIAENMVRSAIDGDWERITPTDMFKAHIREVAEELDSEYNLMMRRF